MNVTLASAAGEVVGPVGRCAVQSAASSPSPPLGRIRPHTVTTIDLEQLVIIQRAFIEQHRGSKFVVDAAGASS